MNNNNNIKSFVNKRQPKILENNIINNLDNYYRKGVINNEENLINYQLSNRNNDNIKKFLNELKDIEERENKMNVMKNEITNNNDKFIGKLKENSEKREIDMNIIINKQRPLSDYNRKFNQQKNYDKENENNNQKIFISENSKENENNIQNEKKSSQTNKDIKINKINKNHISFNKKVISDKLLNNFNENEPKKIILNKLKVENINLKVKNGLLKTSLEKKDKIIEALNNKINELENKNSININSLIYSNKKKYLI